MRSKKILQRLTTTAMLLILAQSANATLILNPGEIKQLHFWEGVNGVLIKHADMQNPDNCARNDQYLLRKEHPLYKEFYAMLLVAHMSGQPVRLGIHGCEQNFPSVLHVYSNK
jgi:hypothetical protein